MIHIRRAGPLDSGAIAELLNEIIAIGGTTAYVEPFSTAAMSDRITASNSVWHLAENDAGALMGVQWFIPHPDIPADSASIATFVRIGETGLGL